MKNLIVFSGGQDSTTCLAFALKQGHQCYTISFNYGQTNIVEMNYASIICGHFGVPNILINMKEFGKISNSALTGEGSVLVQHPLNEQVPASFVPNRNMLFLTFAHSVALNLGCDLITTGVSQEDYSGYPDCREEFINSLQNTLNLSTSGCKKISIWTPLIHMHKKDIFACAEDLGILDIITMLSHTCYNNDHETKHDWGYGCGTCPACLLREKGWNQYKGAKNDS